MKRKKAPSSTEQNIPFQDLELDDPIPFHIRPLQHTVSLNSLKEEAHRHNFQELLWISEGEGLHNVDNVVLKIKPHMFYLIAKGQVHYFLRDFGLKGYLIRFTDDFFFSEAKNIGWDYHSILFNLFTIRQSLKVDKEDVAMFEEIMNRMLIEFNKKALGYLPLLRHLLSVLFILMERLQRKESQNNNNLIHHHKIHQKFTNLLEKNYKKQHTVSHYAHKLCMTERQLSDIVRKQSGKTAKRLILERLILEAKRYLQHTNASVKEIAYTVGFPEPSHFSKVFKQITGLSPSSFRS